MEQIDDLYKQRSKLQDKALALYKKFEQNNTLTAQDWSSLGHELYMLMLPVDAINAYLKAIDIALNFKGEQRRELIVIYGDLSGVYEETEDYIKAHEYLEKSYLIRCEFYDKENYFLRSAKERLVKLKKFMEYTPNKDLEKELHDMVTDFIKEDEETQNKSSSVIT